MHNPVARARLLMDRAYQLPPQQRKKQTQSSEEYFQHDFKLSLKVQVFASNLSERTNVFSKFKGLQTLDVF